MIVLLAIAFIYLLVFYPSQIPAPWFDEGWTLATARHWAGHGRYARLLNNEPISATGMAWNFPVTGPIALSFRLFGVGFWQGRLPNTIFTILSIFLVYMLARKMYDEKTAFLSTLILILGFPFPLDFGRQAIGEPTMIFYVLAGYLCFWLYFENHSWMNLVASILLWSAALVSKNQTLPFWAISMLAVIFLSGIQKNVFIFRTSVITFVGTIIGWQLMLRIQGMLESELLLYGAPMQGLLRVTGWVPIWEVRVRALRYMANSAWPVLFGLAYATFPEQENLRIGVKTEPLFYLRLAYWSFTCSWLLWFAALAMPWNRYLYPAVFFGSVFVAALLLKLSDGLHLPRMIRAAATVFRKFPIRFNGLAALFCFVLLSYMAAIIIINMHHTSPNNDIEKVSQYLNRATPANARIETYDSELLLLVDRQFHYPPDQLQVELNRRTMLHQPVTITYDPMQADPDYIVIGPFGNVWSLYNTTVSQQETWKLIYELPTYQVYERIR